MVRILLLGASGLVGRETLRLALDRREVDGVIAPRGSRYLPTGINEELVGAARAEIARLGS
jgi:uncharacterized protein YbjT (DUF2867 family)